MTVVVLEQGTRVVLPFDLEGVMRFAPPELLIERFAKEHDISEADAREQFDEVKKFLAICASNRSRSFAPSKHLDDMWHAFVLFTSDYFRFCGMIGGYIHHRPTREVMHDSYANTLEVMPKMFGGINSKWWKVRSAADCDGGTCENYCSDAPNPDPKN